MSFFFYISGFSNSSFVSGPCFFACVLKSPFQSDNVAFLKLGPNHLNL